MTCQGVQERLSEWLDGELATGVSRAVSEHLAACGGCARHAEQLRAVSGLLGELQRLEPAEAGALALQLELAGGARRPGLALLFRTVFATRPHILPSLLTAASILLLAIGAILAFDTGPLPEVKSASPWNVAPVSGTEGNPLFPSAEVGLPQQRAALAPEVLAKEGEDSVFLETVVARDGSVTGVTVLQGDASVEQALIDALRQQRFEPVRYRGRFVAVSVYRLISRMEVRSPRT
jgi:anti-sigma factor RsiW